MISWFGSLSTRRLAILVLVTGLVLRIVLGLFYTYPIEDNYWILGSTNLTAGEGLYGVPGYYYLPVWGYFLAVMTAVANFLGIPYGYYYDDIGTSLKDCDVIVPSIEYSLMVLAVLIIFDILVAHLIFRIGCRVTGDERKAVIMAAIWFLCPLTIAISSIRLMFENVEIFFLLASVLMLDANLNRTFKVFREVREEGKVSCRIRTSRQRRVDLVTSCSLAFSDIRLFALFVWKGRNGEAFIGGQKEHLTYLTLLHFHLSESAYKLSL